MTTKTRIFLIAFTALFVMAGRTDDAFSQDKISWKDFFSDITPCAINAAIFLGADNRSVEKIATVYLEFPDVNHMFQYSMFTEPLPISITSFSSGDSSVVHDFYTDKIVPLPQKLLPFNSFSMDGDEDSFFNTIVLTDKNLDIDVEVNNIELSIESPELRISPGIYIKNVTGYLWADAESMRPRKMALSGTVDMGTGKDALINMMLDFSYSKFGVSTAAWKKLGPAIETFQKNQKASEETIRAAEKASGKLPGKKLPHNK